MGACTSSPAKEDARPLQHMSRTDPPSGKNATKAPQNAAPPPPPAATSATTHVQPAHANGVVGASTPVANETGTGTPTGDDAADLAAFLNDGPVSPTQAEMVAGAGNGNAQPKNQKDRSYAIDKQIEEDSRKFKKECKILLLGKHLPTVTPMVSTDRPMP